jgi:hypothetical protein
MLIKVAHGRQEAEHKVGKLKISLANLLGKIIDQKYTTSFSPATDK